MRTCTISSQSPTMVASRLSAAGGGTAGSGFTMYGSNVALIGITTGMNSAEVPKSAVTVCWKRSSLLASRNAARTPSSATTVSTTSMVGQSVGALEMSKYASAETATLNATARVSRPDEAG